MKRSLWIVTAYGVCLLPCLLLSHHRGNLLRNGKFLVGRHHEGADGGSSWREIADFASDSRRTVALQVDTDAEVCKRLGNQLPNHRRVLANSGSEHQRIEPSEDRQVSADLLLQTMHVDFDSQVRDWISGLTPQQDCSHVDIAAESQQAAAFVE